MSCADCKRNPYQFGEADWTACPCAEECQAGNGPDCSRELCQMCVAWFTPPNARIPYYAMASAGRQTFD